MSRAAERGKEEESAVRTGSGLWMYAVNVGKADAILVGYKDVVCLVDTGYARSMGKIRAALKQVGAGRIDAVFVTHTDADHVGGLDWLAKSGIEVGAWYASAMFLGVKEEKHPAVKAAAVRNRKVGWLKAGDCVDFGEVKMEVLAPGVRDRLKDDNNSLVMMFRGRDGAILLGGDMEFSEEKRLLKSGAKLKCNVLKVASHAGHDTFSRKFLQAAKPQAAVISTSSKEKPGTPHEHVLRLLKEEGVRTVVTEEATGGILIRVEEKKAALGRIDLMRPDSKVYIKRVSQRKNRIVIYNGGNAAESLSGWYLTDNRGGDCFVFPEGTVLPPGKRIVVGTADCVKKMDLRWTEKRRIYRARKDVITLYNDEGMTVSAGDSRQKKA